MAASTTGAWASSRPWPVCARLSRQGRRLPFDLEVIGFAEEEGQRYKATFLGSGALIGQFNPAWLDQKDADGITMREAMQHAGLCVDDIARLQAQPGRLPGLCRSAHRAGPGAQ
jgi:N-carbamoyl-L-amino-acid hydrolase